MNTQIDLLKSEDKNVRNTAIAQAKADGMAVKEIAELAGINSATVYRIAANYAPAEAVEAPAEPDEIEQAHIALLAEEAEALETPASKAAATKAANKAKKQAAKDAEFEGTTDKPAKKQKAKATEAPAPKPFPGSGVVVDGETYISWTRKTRNGDLLTVCNPQAIGADPSEGKWVTLCEKHEGVLVYSDTQKDARTIVADDFCDDCRKAHKREARALAKAEAAKANA
jgi:hypothetical protein